MQARSRLRQVVRVGLLGAAATLLVGAEGCDIVFALFGVLLESPRTSTFAIGTVSRETGVNRTGTRIAPSSAAAGAEFGAAVAVTPEPYASSLVVGAPRDTIGGDESGSAWVFANVSSAGGPVEARLVPPPSDRQDGMRFGDSVSIDGDVGQGIETWVAVGAPGEAPSGSVYVFRHQGALAEPWTLDAKLVSPGAAAAARFGSCVSFAFVGQRTLLLVGAPLEPAGGVVHVFRHDGFAWVPDLATRDGATLPRTDAAMGDRFGASIASDTLRGFGSRDIVVGAPGGGELSAGAAYVYRYLDGAWIRIAQFAEPQPRTGGQFGTAVAQYSSVNSNLRLLHTVHVVGAPGTPDGSAGPGAVHVFEDLLEKGSFEGSYSGLGSAVGVAPLDDKVTRFLAVSGGQDDESAGPTPPGYAVVHDVTVAYDENAGHTVAHIAPVDEIAGAAGAADDRFGRAVAVRREKGSGETTLYDVWKAFVGAPRESPSGAVHMFEFDATASPGAKSVARPAKKPAAPAAGDRYVAFRVDTRAPTPASATLALDRTLRPPFRVEIAAGSFDAAKRAGLTGGTVTMEFEKRDAEPAESASLVLGFAADGLAISAATQSGATGSTLSLPGTWIADLAADCDGTTLRLEARRRDSGTFTTIASIPAAGATFLPALRIDGIGAGAEVGFDDPVVTNASVPPGAPPDETARDRIHAAIDRQLEALTELDSGGGAQAGTLLDAAGAKLTEARAGLDAMLAATKRSRTGPAPARRFVEKASRALAKARTQLAQGKPASAVTKTLSKAFVAEGRALQALAP